MWVKGGVGDGIRRVGGGKRKFFKGRSGTKTINMHGYLQRKADLTYMAYFETVFRMILKWKECRLALIEPWYH